ncbi:hypothetical protein GDO78_018317 [Eleutherodactylus coqui]|uniref:Uncharacterized protein n=1 Tax=Eleutherodactylus coqui TaxID=57060 RepID=A0A8J6BM04_ELECQ|nr:hypothetical protein GDO78_018317 [Eleutherodactylus coqui]
MQVSSVTVNSQCTEMAGVSVQVCRRIYTSLWSSSITEDKNKHLLELLATNIGPPSKEKIQVGTSSVLENYIGLIPTGILLFPSHHLYYCRL